MKFALVLRQRRLAQSKVRRPPRLKHIFPFFELPLELREAIYDEYLEDRDEQRTKDGTLKYRAYNTPSVNLLLVSKRFKQEYEGRTRQSMSLGIEDRFSGHNHLTCSLSNLAAKSPRAVASILVFHRSCPEELAIHKKWLRQLLKQLKALTFLRLIIKIARECLQKEKGKVEDFLRWLSATLSAAFVAEVHGAEYDYTENSEMKSEFVPMMRWSHEKGKLEDIEEEEPKDVEN